LVLVAASEVKAASGSSRVLRKRQEQDIPLDFVSVEFHRLEEPTTKPYCGPYQGKLDIGPEEIEAITENEGMALSEMLTTMRFLATNVDSLTNEMKWVKWAVGIGLTVTGLLVALK
jgi:hypothetical protein